MLVCKDFNLLLLQRGDRVYIGITESKEEFVRHRCRLSKRLPTRECTGRHDQGVQEEENRVGPDRHRVESCSIVLAQECEGVFAKTGYIGPL